MMIFIGLIIVIVCVIGAYMGHGGHILVLWQPAEFIIILGSSIGALIVGNTRHVLSQLGKSLSLAMRGAAHTKNDYTDLLSMQCSVFKWIKSKGMIEFESHIESPKESSVFLKYPSFLHHPEAVVFFCDYLRMMSMGSENPLHMEELMQEEIDLHHQSRMLITTAVQNMADSMPALGIVAAVLGVIHTMGSINQPPEVLGKLIGAALVGTFLGILISYGFIGPLANIIRSMYDQEIKYFQCLKAGLVAFMGGYPPVIAVEWARKAIEAEFRPSFEELEKALSFPSSDQEGNNTP